MEEMTETTAKKAKRKALMKAWRLANQDHVRAYQQQWKKANAESVKTYNQAYQPEYQSKAETQFATWIRNLRRNYQMTPMQFNELWAKQEGKCGICEVSMLPRGRASDAACVDHNHKTKEVRGLLCRACNHGIGCLKDSPKVLHLAMKYLLKRGHYSDHQSCEEKS